MSFDNEMIMAYVDGELDLVTAKRVERAAEQDADLARRIAEERRLKERLAGHFTPVLDDPVPERLTALLSGVDTTLEQRRNGGALRGTRPRVVQWAAMAATLVLGLVVGQTLLAPSAGPVAVEDGTLVAKAELAEALDVQLASSQGEGSATRIGLTFRDRDGVACRTFEATALSGIACRKGEDWQIRRSYPGAADTAYRQASAGDIAEAAADMMQGSPLDAAGEERLRDAGWR